MKKKQAAVGMMAALLGLSTVLTGCGSKDPNNAAGEKDKQVTESGTGKADTSEEVELRFILMGEQPKAGAAVMEEVNKKLKADINATISIEYVPFSDMTVTLPLRLSTPDEWDIMLSTPIYASQAPKNAFREITMEEVERYMPLTYACTKSGAWDDTKIGGKIYMIPQSFAELGMGSLFIRDDLRVKYGMEPVTTYEDLIEYTYKVKENETDIVPIKGTYSDYKDTYANICYDGWIETGTRVFYNVNSPADNIEIKTIFDEEIQNLWKDKFKVCKQLFEDGIFTKNPYADQTGKSDYFFAGASAINGSAFENFPAQEAGIANTGGTVAAFPSIDETTGVGIMRPATGNGYSISPSCKYADRCMMALDLINNDYDYDMLISFGIKGVNYDIDESGRIVDGPDVADGKEDPYAAYSHGFWACNRDLWPANASYSEAYLSAKEKILDKVVSLPIAGFNFVDTNVKTETANISALNTELWDAMALGMVDDVDIAFAEYLEQLKAAGLEKVIAEWRTQYDEFVKNRE